MQDTSQIFFSSKHYFVWNIVLFGNIFTHMKTLFGSDNTSQPEIWPGPLISSRLHDCVTPRVTCVWHVWCNTHIHQQNFLTCRHILGHVLSCACTHLKRIYLFGSWKWGVWKTQNISEVSKPHLYLAPPQIEITCKHYLAQKVTKRTLSFSLFSPLIENWL